ncbi:unnamed protein product [Coregonus sp. 'balchen']|uniref:Uncharacterized protein n=1 Tax=Coregonus suidteri TaxID=861788 RepID=A0AAN8KJK6_9TELE|nr:unnamed protein product [Coregonus sp. 'balchen']
MEVYKYPVFFECQTLDPSQKEKIKKYFEIRRKSGGGDCGPVESVGDNVYKVAFIYPKVQERVLQKTHHVLEMPGGPLSLTLRGSLETTTPVSSQASHQLLPLRPSFPVQTSPPGDLEHELHLDSYLLRYLKESPGAGKGLQQQLASLSCSVHLHPEDGRAVVRGSGQAYSCGDGVGVGVGPWKAQVEKLFKHLHERYQCHYEVDACKLQTLLQRSTLGSEDVRVYCEAGFAVVVGEGAEVQAKLKELEAFQAQGLSSGKQEKVSTTCRLGQAKLRLLGEVIEKDLVEAVPGVRVMRGDSAQLVLEGSASEVRTARQLVIDKISLVLERVVPEVSLHLLSFLRQEYGRPEHLSSLLGLGRHVKVELGDTELRLFAISSYKLDQAEKVLLGEFGEEKIDLPNCPALPAELKSKLEKKVKEMNQSRHRVVARYGPGCRVQLLGHLKQVQELSEEIGAFLMDQNNGGVVGEAGPGPRREETVAATSYHLHGGLQVVVCQGDITKERADALVNTANEDLDHAGGVAAALSRAGGPEVQRASRDLVRQIGRVPTGTVVETTGGNLPCKMLLHAVGPVGGSVGGNERPLLEKTVMAALDLAETLELQTLAMPCISSGIFGVPLKVCSEAIVSAVRDFGREQHILTKVTLIDVSGEAVKAMQEACDRLFQGKREFSGWEGESSTTTTTTTHAPQRDTTSASSREAATPEVCVQVEIIQGTIEKQQVDALVSPMVGSDPLSSRVGNVLSEAAGPGLMKAFLRESGGQTAPGDNVLVEGLTGLSSGRVFFLSCAQWDNNPQGPAVQVLRQGVRKILTSCENRGFCSVAFPVVETGVVLRFPQNVATRVLLEEVRRYEQNRASQSPFLVHIIVHPNERDSTKAFQTAQNALPRMGTRPEQDIRIVLLGKSGGGKSSAGNTIFGQGDVFLADSNSTSATQICKAQTKNIKGRNITLIDTPGLFDTDIPKENLKPIIVKCITECAPGPHAFLIVLKVERYTVHEKEAVANIEKYFSPEAFKYATVLFTHGEQLNGLTIEKFVQQNAELNKLVEKCGGRYHVIDNKYWNTSQQGRHSNQYQVAELLNTIEKMVTENRGRFYTNEMLQEAEREIQAEIESLRKESKDQMSEEEMRKQAQESVWKKCLIKLSGITAGVVVGAFLGVALGSGIPLTLATKPLVHLGKRQMAASMKTVQTVMETAAGPVLAGETGALMGMVSGIGIGAWVRIGARATAGAVRGGIVGATVAEEAETVQEAAEKAASAVYNEAKGLYGQAGRRIQ